MPLEDLDWTEQEVSCSLVNEINDSDTRCGFVKENFDCHKDESFLSYIVFLYCFYGTPHLPVILGVLWLLMLFLALGCTASSFLCPSLVVISKSLKLSQTVAGVTLLAFGNGAPDIVSCFAGIRQGRPSLVIGELFGGAMLVITVVVGLIFITSEFDLIQRPLLRDVIFYLAASYWMFFLFMDGEFRLVHAVGFMSLYIVYILVAIIGRKVYNKIKKIHVFPIWAVAKVDGIVEGQCAVMATRPRLRRSSTRSSLHHHYENALYQLTSSMEMKSENDYRRSYSRAHSIDEPMDSIMRQTPNGSTTQESAALETHSIHGKDTAPLLQHHQVHENYTIREEIEDLDELLEKGIWKYFLLHLMPINTTEWNENKWYVRAFEIVSFPIYFTLILTVPVVDLENRRGNWCKCLNVMHCIICPLFACMITKQGDVYIFPYFPLWSIFLIFGTILAVIVWMTSEHAEVPKYQWVFGYVGFFISILWIYGIATEIVSVLKAFGILYGISDTLLGMTVLAWGNSIGDTTTNMSVARQGLPQMAISACFGGPLLVLLFGVGTSFLVTFIAGKTDSMALQYTQLITVLYSALVISMTFILISMLVSWFRAKRWIGITLLVIYGCFVIVAISVEVVTKLMV